MFYWSNSTLFNKSSFVFFERKEHICQEIYEDDGEDDAPDNMATREEHEGEISDQAGENEGDDGVDAVHAIASFLYESNQACFVLFYHGKRGVSSALCVS